MAPPLAARRREAREPSSFSRLGALVSQPVGDGKDILRAPAAAIPAHVLACQGMGEPSARTDVRLAELLAVLSLATDLGMGQPMEHVLRQCLISMRLAELMGLGHADREVVYYTALISWVGCHVDAYEQAKWFGDDTALKADFRLVDFGSPLARPLFMLRHLGSGRPAAERARLGVAFLGDGRRAAEAMLDNHWTAADALAARLGLPQQVRDSVEQTFERWDGKGVPKGARGREIAVHTRLVTLADVVEVYHRAGGTEAAIAVARQRCGTQQPPHLRRETAGAAGHDSVTPGCAAGSRDRLTRGTTPGRLAECWRGDRRLPPAAGQHEVLHARRAARGDGLAGWRPGAVPAHQGR